MNFDLKIIIIIIIIIIIVKIKNKKINNIFIIKQSHVRAAVKASSKVT